MFGYPAVFVNGNMFAGLVRDKMILRLGETDRTKFLAWVGRALRRGRALPPKGGSR